MNCHSILLGQWVNIENDWLVLLKVPTEIKSQQNLAASLLKCKQAQQHKTVLPNRGENPTTRGKSASVGKMRGNSKKGKIEGKWEFVGFFEGFIVEIYS